MSYAQAITTARVKTRGCLRPSWNSSWPSPALGIWPAPQPTAMVLMVTWDLNLGPKTISSTDGLLKFPGRMDPSRYFHVDYKLQRTKSKTKKNLGYRWWLPFLQSIIKLITPQLEKTLLNDSFSPRTCNVDFLWNDIKIQHEELLSIRSWHHLDVLSLEPAVFLPA